MGITAYPRDGMLLIEKDKFTVYIYKLFTGSRSGADTGECLIGPASWYVNENKGTGTSVGEGPRAVAGCLLVPKS